MQIETHTFVINIARSNLRNNKTRIYIYVDHDLDFSTTATYNSSLRTHISGIIVDDLEFEPEISKVDREKAMKARGGSTRRS